MAVSSWRRDSSSLKCSSSKSRKNSSERVRLDLALSACSIWRSKGTLASAALAKIGAAALIDEDFQKTSHAAGSRVGKHDGLWPPGSAGSVDAGRNNLAFVIGLREDAKNRIKQIDEK